ncbi:MAG: hypothetical protein ABGX26_02825 [Nautiliaceae bacterium]
MILKEILKSDENDINLDFNDLDLICSHLGFAFVNKKRGKPDDILKTLFPKNISSFKGALIYFKTHSEFPLLEIERVVGKVYELGSEESDIIFGNSTDDSLDKEEMEVVLILSGIEG